MSYFFHCESNFDNDTILTNTFDIATSLNDFFSNIVSTYLSQVNTSAPNYGKLKSYIDSKIPDEVNFDIHPISYDFVLKELSSLDSKKAIGADGLSSRLLKLTAKLIATAITMIMNLSISYSLEIGQDMPNIQKWKKRQ